MRILYLSQKNVAISKNGIYEGLLYTLINNGHSVTIVCTDSAFQKTRYVNNVFYDKIEVKASNQFGVNIIKKGIVFLSLESKIKRAISKYLDNNEYDLILYATPPITFCSVIKYCKKKYNCKSYLMLKDIFPQNSVDLEMLSKKGIKGLIYKFFRKKEKALYKYSDKIGCMSQANIDYLLSHNSIDRNKIEYFPNSIIIKSYEPKDKRAILNRLGIDDQKIVFIFGGNLGKPQGIDFLIKGINACQGLQDAHFLIVGKGTEKKKVDRVLKDKKNVTVLDFLSHSEYQKLLKECDVGLIMLDKRFTIPNYPSRILSYMENSLPILACTDKSTDIKELVEEQAKCGKWIVSDNSQDFAKSCQWFIQNRDKLTEIGLNGRRYLEDNFDIIKHIYKIERMIND